MEKTYVLSLEILETETPTNEKLGEIVKIRDRKNICPLFGNIRNGNTHK